MSRILDKRHKKWYAAVEQSGLSGSNFLFSLAVVRFGDVATLGEYGFWFVLCQLMAMIALGLAIRQMVLQSANGTVGEQHRALGDTLRIVLALQLVQSVALAILVSLRSPAEGAVTFALSLVLYTAAVNLSVLFRQYLYLCGRQRLSLLYTTIGLVVGLVAFVFVVAGGPHLDPAAVAFWFLALGHGLYAVIALGRTATRRALRWAPGSRLLERMRSYWVPGRPAMAGMAVTWLQNQSVTPLLMLMLGPVAVGYYQIARMVFTPVNMVNSGLAMNALPHLRRAYGDGDEPALSSAIAGHRRVSMRVVVGYVVFAALVWVIASVFGWIETAHDVAPMLVATALVMILSNYRFWFSQRFVVRMQFGVLLSLGIIASVLAIVGMLIGGYGFGQPALVILGSAIGEVFLLLALRKRLREERR